jgi:iron uptake system component EfeO
VDYSAQLAAPIAEYKQYVSSELEGLLSQSKAFAAAIKAGDLKKAQGLYAITRQHYERIEPIAELFSDMDAAIDAREDDFKQKAADPKFTGFHRLEKALFGDHTTKGQAQFADKLVADITELNKRVATLDIPPAKMVGGAAGLIEEVAATKVSGEEDRYSHTDLWDFQANVDGAQKIVELLRPLLQKPARTCWPRWMTTSRRWTAAGQIPQRGQKRLCQLRQGDRRRPHRDEGPDYGPGRRPVQAAWRAGPGLIHMPAP